MARSTLADLIALVRSLIADPAGSSQQFSDDDIQMHLDHHRDDIRYEGMTIAPSIVNAASTSNQAQTIFADYYSQYKFWESDAVIQGQGPNAAPWIVLTPVFSEFMVGHWQFELNVFTSGTVPGQLPPCFITGKTFDPYASSADLLEIWANVLAGAYDIVVDGQSLHRSQLMQAKMSLAQQYRRRAKPEIAKQSRHDVLAPISSRRMRLLDSDDIVKGA